MDLLNITSAEISTYSMSGMTKRNTTAVSTYGAQKNMKGLKTTDNR